MVHVGYSCMDGRDVGRSAQTKHQKRHNPKTVAWQTAKETMAILHIYIQ